MMAAGPHRHWDSIGPSLFWSEPQRSFFARLEKRGVEEDRKGLRDACDVAQEALPVPEKNTQDKYGGRS